MNTMIKKNITLLILTLPILFIAAITSAQYTPPAGAAPNNNPEALVTIGATDQVKPAGLAVNTFSAAQNASFNRQVFLSGIVTGGQQAGNNSKLQFGGSDPVNGSQRTVDLQVNGEIATTNGIYSDTLKTGAGNGEKELCATTDGTLVLCAAPSVPSSAGPIYVVALSSDQFSGNTIQCDDGFGGTTGQSVEDGKTLSTVTLNFYESRDRYNLEQSGNSSCWFNACKYDVTGKNMKIKYTLNGNPSETPILSGTSYTLFVDLPTMDIQGNPDSCSVVNVPINPYAFPSGLSEPVPYEVR